MIHVSIGLDNLTGLWKVVHIIVNKDGQSYVVKHGDEFFAGKIEAERDAQMRARRLLKQKFAIGNDGDIQWDIWPPSLDDESPLS